MSIIVRMKRKMVSEGDIIFKQGDVGDSLYVAWAGNFPVEIEGRQVKVLKRGCVFGELALLYNVNRTWTVLNSNDSPGVLFQLDAGTVKHTLKRLNDKSAEKILWFLWTDPNMSKLTLEERTSLWYVSTIQEYNPGDTILREGEVSEWMFIVMNGKVMTRDQFGNYNT